MSLKLLKVKRNILACKDVINLGIKLSHIFPNECEYNINKKINQSLP